MKLPVRFLPALLTAALLAAVLPGAARADDTETASIKFSDPAKPGTLKLSVNNGDIRLRGADTGEITVRTDLKPDKPAQRKDGLRVLSSSTSYSLTEKDNVVTLSYGADAWPTGGGDFDIVVPRTTNVVISNSLGGDVKVGDITGSIEIKSLNGEVKLFNVTSSALVETMNGEIHADLQAMTEGKPVSFTSMNGEVKVAINPAINANIRLRTHNGSILTDFDEKQLVTKTASLKAQHTGKYGLSKADAEQIRVAVRDAVRVGMDAAREATRAAREAIRDAKEDAADAGEAPEAEEDSEETEVEAPVAPVPPVPPLPPMTGGKIVTGTLNGGGPELRISTMNGDVTLRKADAK